MKRINLIVLLLASILYGCNPGLVVDFNVKNRQGLKKIDHDVSPPDTSKLEPGDIIKVGNEIFDSITNISLDVRKYQWPDRIDPITGKPIPGEETGEGWVEIETPPVNHAGGDGYEIHFMNATLAVRDKVGFDVKKIIFKHADLGGNINLYDGVDWYNDEDFGLISPTPNGLVISVKPSGEVHLSGKLNKFKISGPTPQEKNIPIDRYYIGVLGGGQELWIDDLILKK